MNTEEDPKRRFSNRVHDYVKYRPYYPGELFHLLERVSGLTTATTVADIGSGTGNLARLFVENGNLVYGVEPNDEMRKAGEEALCDFLNFTSINGTAEDSTLPDDSVDLVTAGQSFHWFDQTVVRPEFMRILRLEGYIMLIWNDWDGRDAPLNNGMRRLQNLYGRNFGSMKHKNTSGRDSISRFFESGNYGEYHLENFQLLDFEGLVGRTLSSSYGPTRDDPNFLEFEERLRRVYSDLEEYDQFGVSHVRLEYDTIAYIGSLR